MLKAIANSPGSIAIARPGAPVGVPSSGTIGNNGALSGIASVSVVTSMYLYFPANAIFAGSAAGFYWTVMSSGTAGTIYNNTYTPGSTPTPPTSPVPFVTTGPGAYTQSTSEITVRSATVPGGMMGANGRIRIRDKILNTNSAGTKTLKAKFGASTVVYSDSVSTSTNNIWDYSFENMGNASLQLLASWPTPIRAGGGSFATSTVDTSVDQTLSVTVTLGSAADTVVWLMHAAELLQ